MAITPSAKPAPPRPSVPVERHEQNNFPPSPTAGLPKPGLCPRLRVLYAEDLAELRELMRIFFSQRGDDLQLASDGREAETMLAAAPHSFDLLITDHWMPLMTGLELVRRARALGYMGKIIVLSSALSAGDQTAFRALGADEIMEKPFSLSAFSELLGRMFDLAPLNRDAAGPTTPSA